MSRITVRESFDDRLAELTLSLSKRYTTKNNPSYDKETKIIVNRLTEIGLDKSVLLGNRNIDSWCYSMLTIKDTKHDYIRGMRLTSIRSIRSAVEYMEFKSKSGSTEYRDFITKVIRSSLSMTKRLALMSNFHARHLIQTFAVSFKIFYTLYRSNVTPFKISNYNNWLSAFIIVFNAGIREINDHNHDDHCVEIRNLIEITKLIHADTFMMNVNTLDKCIFKRGISFIDQEMFIKYKDYVCTTWYEYCKNYNS